MSLAFYNLFLLVESALREFYTQGVLTGPNNELALVPYYRRVVIPAIQ